MVASGLPDPTSVATGVSTTHKIIKASRSRPTYKKSHPPARLCWTLVSREFASALSPSAALGSHWMSRRSSGLLKRCNSEKCEPERNCPRVPKPGAVEENKHQHKHVCPQIQT